MTTEPAQDCLPAIEMNGVSVSSLRDSATIVVEAIDWKVSHGDFWVVAGLQGSGKTDFLMMAASLMSPAAGAYRLYGETMPIFEEHRLKERLRLGLVFESGQLLNHLTVKENVALPLRYHLNTTKEAANDLVQPWLEALELGPWADSTPGAIGRNWARRVGLARALVLQPQILLADNPLGGLDLRHARWWLGFLAQLSKGHPLMNGQPLTIVATTADLRPWEKVARQFAILRGKRLRVLGTWDQLEAASEELLKELLVAEDHNT
jgi:ABC-type transporter Mla maintaining outer membrane lipid asymmetry ATPase subunit MlaF